MPQQDQGMYPYTTFILQSYPLDRVLGRKYGLGPLDGRAHRRKEMKIVILTLLLISPAHGDPMYPVPAPTRIT